MSTDTYLTVSTSSSGVYKEKGSKFLAFAYPVSTIGDVEEKLDEVRKKYHDARHHCYAYMLGKEQDVFRANDDGEPNHSAGDPILGQIRSNNLSDVLIVVVRYFGGTKLGVGGLIHAYKTAAADALEQNSFTEKIVTIRIVLAFEYSAMNDVMSIVKQYELKVLKQDFQLSCKIELEIRESIYEQVSSQLTKFGEMKNVE